MQITLADFQKQIPAAYIKDGKKLFSRNAVRELEEEAKGVYIAFADEGADSFDVRITIGEKGAITAHQCDCKSTYAFCKHKIAVLFQLTTAQKQEKKQAVSKKISPAEALLKTVDLQQLQTWVLALLQKNKDIELSFTSYFRATEAPPTPAQIQESIAAAVKAVLKNRKKAEQAEIKKITSLWQDINEPIITRCLADIPKKEHLESIFTIIETCIDYDRSLIITGNKIVKYTEDILKTLEKAVLTLADTEGWVFAVTEICSRILASDKHLRLYYAQLLISIAGESNTEKKKTIAALLAGNLKQIAFQESYQHDEFKELLLPFVSNEGLFGQYNSLFTPIIFRNDYNIRLIGALIDLEEYGKAEKYCTQQIASNYQDQYNFPYRLLLRKIYEARNEREKLMALLKILVPDTFNFTDYRNVYDALADSAEKNKWRNKIFTKATHNISYRKDALEFCFELLHHEGKYKKMLELFYAPVPFTTIIRYFQPLFTADKELLLKKLIAKTKVTSYQKEILLYSDDDFTEEIASLVIANYTDVDIRSAIFNDDNWGYYPKPLKKYLTGILSPDSTG